VTGCILVREQRAKSRSYEPEQRAKNPERGANGFEPWAGSQKLGE